MNKRVLAILAKVLVSASLMVFLYSRLDLGAVKGLLAQWRAWPAAFFLALLFLNTFISSLKWRLILSADNIVVSQGKLFLSYFVAGFFTVLLPSTIGGDTYRVYDISRSGSKPGHIIASVFADRLTGFLALSVLGLSFSLIGFRLVPNPLLLLIPLAVFAMLMASAWLLWQQTFVRRMMTLTRADRVVALNRFATRFLDSMAAYRRRPRVILQAMAISFWFQANVILAIYALTLALNIRIPLALLCIIVPVVSLIEAVPISIFGIGLRDSGYMLFFSQMGHTREEAGALAILYVALTFAYSALGGIVFIFKPKPAAATPSSPAETP